MSILASAALQSAVYARLIGDQALGQIVGTAIFDMPPAGLAPDLYVLIGAEEVRDLSSWEAPASQHDLLFEITSHGQGFTQAKLVASALYSALVAPLSVGAQKVKAQFVGAQARVVSQGDTRRIDLNYRVFLG